MDTFSNLAQHKSMYMVVTKGNGKDVASSIVLQTEVQRMYLQADSFAKTNDKMCVCMCVCVCVCVCVCARVSLQSMVPQTTRSCLRPNCGLWEEVLGTCSGSA